MILSHSLLATIMMMRDLKLTINVNWPRFGRTMISQSTGKEYLYEPLPLKLRLLAYLQDFKRSAATGKLGTGRKIS